MLDTIVHFSWFLGGISLIALVWAYIANQTCSWPLGDKTEKRMIWGFLVASVVLFGWTIVLTVVIPEKTVLLTNGKPVRVFPEHTRLWVEEVWQLKKVGEFHSYAMQDVTVGMNLNPITPNPKVRNLHYTVKAQTTGDLEGYLRLYAPKPRSFETLLKYALFDLNEKMSKELSEFYNPLDDDQQDRFRKIVKNFLDGRLGITNVRVYEVRFDFP